MPKQPLLESFRHQFFLCSRIIADREHVLEPSSYMNWHAFISSLEFIPTDPKTISISWLSPKKGTLKVLTNQIVWYFRGDNDEAVKKQTDKNLIFHDDTIFDDNHKWFLALVTKISKRAGLSVTQNTITKTNESMVKHFAEEEKLFDTWAKNTNPKDIDVIQTNESCTAPEMRYIVKNLGAIKGKTLLDVGSGLGEASVYFALKGARVTALDLSSEMLNTTKKLAKKYNVKVNTVQAALEYLHIPKSKKFDIIYGGNIFHHINIPLTLNKLIPHLKTNGKLVCWEPVAYNPLINWYRKIATQVRSDDERPIQMADIALFKTYFNKVHIRWFWLTSLIIFCYMVVFMRRDPNKIRLWKKVVEEGDLWKPIYIPLELIDRALLSLFPFLGPLCWNVVLICSQPKKLLKK